MGTRQQSHAINALLSIYFTRLRNIFFGNVNLSSRRRILVDKPEYSFTAAVKLVTATSVSKLNDKHFASLLWSQRLPLRMVCRQPKSRTVARLGSNTECYEIAR